jgi:hypothetical protein
MGCLPDEHLINVLAAVDMDFRPGNIAGLIRAEHKDHFGDFIRLSQASERNVFDELFGPG